MNNTEPTQEIEMVRSTTGTLHSVRMQRTTHHFRTHCNTNRGIKGTRQMLPAHMVTCEKCLESLSE